MTSLRVFNPWSLLPTVMDDQDEYPWDMGAYLPRVDLFEEGENFILEAQVPGFKKEDIEVSVEGDVVKLVGKAEEKTEKQEGKKYHHREIVRRSFSRAFTMPAEVSSDKVVANYDNGVLRVTLPKSEKARTRKVDISVE